MADLQHTEGGQSTELTAAPITRKTLSGLYVPTDIDGGPEVATAPIDIIDQKPAPDFTSAPPPKREASAVAANRKSVTIKPVPSAPRRNQPVEPSPEPASAPAPPKSGGWAKLGALLYDRIASPKEEEPVTLSAVITVGAFALAAAVCAFLLSFQMILPVVMAAGWTGFVAYLGPVVIDVAAVAAAFMSVLSRHPSFTRTGMLLLVSSTALSIVLNLAGHQVKTDTGGSDPVRVPAGWEWTVNLFSVVVPLLLAWLIHAFGKAITAYMNARSREQAQKAAEEAEAERQAAEQARAEQEAAEADRARVEQANAALATAQQTTPNRAKPQTKSAGTGKGKRKGATKPTATKDVALAVGRRDGICTPAPLRDALDKAGYAPASERAVKGWCAELRKELGTS